MNPGAFVDFLELSPCMYIFLRGSESCHEKSRIRETLNLLTDADRRTDIFLEGGDGKKKKKST